MLSLGALGIVFGDIGTSPLYALRESFAEAHGITLSPANVLGVLSLILWSLTLVIVVKYLGFITRAHNRGEGGVLALLALFMRGDTTQRAGRRVVLVMLGLFGAALLYGEGVITPAISVLSAVEGVNVVTPRFEHLVVPITVVILVGLFLVQKHGTARVGTVFGPVTLLWFISMAIFGVGGILRHPQVLSAVNPWHGVEFFMRNGVTGYFVLGSVVLAFTGAEALYADMGHFGMKPIKAGWFAVVFPALLLNYFGQGALLLTETGVDHPFYELIPRPFLLPMVILATAATVIASQALISGSFSLTRQAIQLGYMPRLHIIHTSAKSYGQIYIPQVNFALAVSCIALVLAFKSASALAAAYGLAVVGTMAIGTVLFAAVARSRWNWPTWKVALFVGVFLTIELAFLGANAVKLFSGAWLPLVMGVIMFTVMATWKQGRVLLARHFERGALPIELFVSEIVRKPPHRVAGAAVFLTANPEGVPPVLLHHLKHNKVLHEKVVLISFLTLEVPQADRADRLQLDELGAGFFRVKASYGFMETPDLPELLKTMASRDLTLNLMDTTFYLGRETLVSRGGSGMARWRKRLFGVMQRNAQSATAFYNVPPNRVVELGAQIEL